MAQHVDLTNAVLKQATVHIATNYELTNYELCFKSYYKALRVGGGVGPVRNPVL